MKKSETVVWCIVLVLLGCFMHMAHEMSFYQPWMGYVFPANECAWEHMKMVFYPLLLLAIVAGLRQRNPGAFSALVWTGVVAIPVQLILFYVYWPFTRHSILIVDIIAYVVMLTAAVVLGNRWRDQLLFRRSWKWAAVAAVLVCGLMTWLTACPGKNFLFWE